MIKKDGFFAAVIIAVRFEFHGLNYSVEFQAQKVLPNIFWHSLDKSPPELKFGVAGETQICTKLCRTILVWIRHTSEWDITKERTLCKDDAPHFAVDQCSCDALPVHNPNHIENSTGAGCQEHIKHLLPRSLFWNRFFSLFFYIEVVIQNKRGNK